MITYREGNRVWRFDNTYELVIFMEIRDFFDDDDDDIMNSLRSHIYQFIMEAVSEPIDVFDFAYSVANAFCEGYLDLEDIVEDRRVLYDYIR